jgi:hypothetical protein
MGFIYSLAKAREDTEGKRGSRGREKVVSPSPLPFRVVSHASLTHTVYTHTVHTVASSHARSAPALPVVLPRTPISLALSVRSDNNNNNNNDNRVVRGSALSGRHSSFPLASLSLRPRSHSALILFVLRLHDTTRLLSFSRFTHTRFTQSTPPDGKFLKFAGHAR